MYRNLNNRSSGFTLIEMLLVITLISISVGVTGDILLSLVRSYNKTNALNEVEQQGNFLGLKLEKELRNSTNVVVPSPTQIEFDYQGEPVFYNVVEDGAVYRTEGLGSTYSTNSADAIIATSAISGTPIGVKVNCDGDCFAVTGTSPQIVTMSLVLSQSTAGGVSFAGEVNIKNTVVLRNTY